MSRLQECARFRHSLTLQGRSSVHLRHGGNACSEQAGPEPDLQRDLPRVPPLGPAFLHASRHAADHRRGAGGPVRLDHGERPGTPSARLPIRTAACLRRCATRVAPRWARWTWAGNRRRSPTSSRAARRARRSTSRRTSSAARSSPSAPRRRSSASRPSSSATARPSATPPTPARTASTCPTPATTAATSTRPPATPRCPTRAPATCSLHAPLTPSSTAARPS